MQVDIESSVDENTSIMHTLSRILIVPWFFSVYGRIRGISTFQAVLAQPWYCAFFMLLVFLPQLYWFRLMVIGAAKVLQDRGKPQENANGVANGDGKKQL